MSGGRPLGAHGRPGPGAGPRARDRAASRLVVRGEHHPLASGPVGVVVAIDAGTTGVRSLAVDESGTIIDVAYRELTQYFPRPGWVEHDPEEIWAHVRATLAELLGRLDGRPAALGITNQRETVVAWDRASGQSLHRAIVW